MTDQGPNRTAYVEPPEPFWERVKAWVSNNQQLVVIVFVFVAGTGLGTLFVASIKHDDRPENCRDSVTEGRCRHPSHKLVVEGEVAVCRCQR